MTKISYNIETIKNVADSIKESLTTTKTSCDINLTVLKKVNEVKSGSVDGIIKQYNDLMDKWSDLSKSFSNYSDSIVDLEDSIVNGTYLPVESTESNGKQNKVSISSTSTDKMNEKPSNVESTESVYGTDYTTISTGVGVDENTTLLESLKNVLVKSGYSESDSNFSILYNKFYDYIVNNKDVNVINVLKQFVLFLNKVPNTKIVLSNDSKMSYDPRDNTLKVGLELLDERSSNYDVSKFFENFAFIINQCLIYYGIGVS